MKINRFVTTVDAKLENYLHEVSFEKHRSENKYTHTHAYPLSLTNFFCSTCSKYSHKENPSEKVKCSRNILEKFLIQKNPSIYGITHICYNLLSQLVCLSLELK